MRPWWSVRSGDAADGGAPPQPFGQPGIAAASFVARRRRLPEPASSSFLGCHSQDPAARPKPLRGQAPYAPTRSLAGRPRGGHRLAPRVPQRGATTRARRSDCESAMIALQGRSSLHQGGPGDASEWCLELSPVAAPGAAGEGVSRVERSPGDATPVHDEALPGRTNTRGRRAIIARQKSGQGFDGR